MLLDPKQKITFALPGHPVPTFLRAKVNTDVGHVSLPAFNLLAIAEGGCEGGRIVAATLCRVDEFSLFSIMHRI